MRVFQLGSSSGLYGAEQWILTLAKHLNPTEVQTWIGAIRDREGEESPPLCREAERRRFPTRVIHAHGRINFSAVQRLRSVLLADRIQILHTHGYKTDLVGLLAVRGTACRILTTPHGWTDHPDMKLRIYELLDRMAFGFFDAVVPLSEELYHSLGRILSLPKRKLYFIRNGVDLTEFRRNGKVPPEIVKE